jgi:hypothetical protein
MINVWRPVYAEWIFNSANDPATTRKLLIARLGQSCSVTDQGSTIECTCGSRLRTWFFGARGVMPNHLPIAITADIAPTTNGSMVRLKLSDRVGIGLRTGVEDVFLSEFEKISTDLARQTGLIGMARPVELTRTTSLSRLQGYGVVALIVLFCLIMLSVIEFIGRVLFALIR